MPYFTLPDLGEGLQEAEVVEWHVKEGDTVKVDDLLLSVETAKAIVDIPAPQDGIIATLFVAIRRRSQQHHSRHPRPGPPPGRQS